ncbi:MAG: PAS domain S-box protein [Desulfobulbaceae bacterium]|nr:PAS domain S-box protein [Desulfobulbaceae bacterium]
MTRESPVDEVELKHQLMPIQWRMSLLICMAGLMITGIMAYGFFTGDRINKVYAPLADAAMEIKLEAITAHLWFEEIISGDRHEDMSVVWHHQDQAEWYAQAMLEGGKNPEGTYVPLDDIEMRGKIKNVQVKLKEFREITQKRLETKNLAGAGSDMDQHYDDVFRRFLQEADEVESKLQQLMSKDLSRFRYTQVFLIVTSIVLFLSIGIVFFRFERRRENDLRTIREAKNNLEREMVERKQAKEALNKSERRYRGLFEESPISLWEEDFSAIKIHIDRLRDSGIADFRSYFESHPEFVRTCAQLVKIIEVNKATLKIFRAESEEVLFESLDQIFGNKSYDSFKEELICLAQGKYNFEIQAFNQTLQGDEIQVILGLSVVPGYEDTWSRVFVSLSDVTERMQAEAELKEYRNHLRKLVNQRTEELKEKTAKIEESRKALTYLLEDVNKSRDDLQKINIEFAAANNELREFAYIVSHDLKAPLRAISQLTQWISEDYSESFDEDGREQMSLVLKRVKRMDGLIDGVLRYSRVGRVKEKEEQLDLNLLVHEVVDNIAPPDTIQIICEDTLPVVLRDPTRMEQVFQNLISNAIKFMDKDEGIIKVGCVDKGAFWKFSVSDNGPGIDKRYHDKIFQIFKTLKARDEYESTGIGLTLVKKIIGLYGGSIWVESATGHGATFFFTLPKQGRKDENL